jgi:hypothetical protein
MECAPAGGIFHCLMAFRAWTTGMCSATSSLSFGQQVCSLWAAAGAQLPSERTAPRPRPAGRGLTRRSRLIVARCFQSRSPSQFCRSCPATPANRNGVLDGTVPSYDRVPRRQSAAGNPFLEAVLTGRGALEPPRHSSAQERSGRCSCGAQPRGRKLK